MAGFTVNPHPAPPPGCTHGFRVDGVFEKTQRDRICLSCYEVDPCCQHGKEPRSRALTQWKQELRAQVTRTLWVLNASHVSPPWLSRASAEISRNTWTSQSVKGHLLQMVKESETPAGSHLWKASFLLDLANHLWLKLTRFRLQSPLLVRAAAWKVGAHSGEEQGFPSLTCWIWGLALPLTVWLWTSDFTV